VETDKPDAELLDNQIRESRRRIREARYRTLTGRERPKDEAPFCSFCGAGRNNSRTMIPNAAVNATAHICDECILAAHDVVQAI